jgi:hypothetical protein
MDDFSEISCHNSGTHALQSMIEIINLNGEEDLIKDAVKNNILTLSFVNMLNNCRIQMALM